MLFKNKLRLISVAAIIAGLLLGLFWAIPTAAKAPLQSNSEDYISEDITIKDNAITRPGNRPLPTATKPKGVVLGSRQQGGWNKTLPERCEQYRETVRKYFGDQTDTALFIASKESGCRMEAVSSTADYCLFQINREPATGKDVDLCIRRAWEKYVGGRVGSDNWSAWYAVCTPGNNPQPKYPGIKCQ